MKPAMPWTPAEIEQVRAWVAQGTSAQKIAIALNRHRKSVIDAVKRYSLGPWRTKPGAEPFANVEIPADFADRFVTSSLEELAGYYRKSMTTVQQWAKRLDLRHPPEWRTARYRRRTKPADFDTRTHGMTIAEQMELYGASKNTIQEWRKGGVTRFIKPNAFATAPVDRPHRDASRAGLAADYLRKFGPVIRCRPDGAYDPKGTCWRRNGRVLTASELIQRAIDNDWQPDAWKQVHAA